MSKKMALKDRPVCPICNEYLVLNQVSGQKCVTLLWSCSCNGKKQQEAIKNKQLLPDHIWNIDD